MNVIRYAKSGKEVHLGDRVQVRMYFFIRRSGRVVYLPGESPLNRELEYRGVRHIGVWLWTGAFYGYEIDPARLTVAKAVKFLGRDDTVAPKWPPEGSWQQTT